MYPKLLAAFARDELLPDSREQQEGSAYRKDFDKLVDAESALLDALTPEQQELLKRFDDAIDVMHVRDKTDKFVYGYRLGVLMTMEVFNMRDDLFIDGEAE